MKYIKYLFLVLSITVIRDVISYTSGANPGYTAAISEGNCTSCHSSYSIVSSGTQWNRVRMKSNIPSTGYLPDSTYNITITYAEFGIAKFGFQLTALDTTNTAAGTFSTADNRTSTSNTSVSGKTRYYIGHTTTGSSRIAQDSTAWTFKWKAPSTNVGKVKWFTTVNSTNNNGSDNGDYIYKKDFTITPSTLLSVASAKMSDAVACTNGTKFSGSATNSPTAYLWEEKPATGANTRLSTAQNPSIALTAGKHTILFTATNAYGKSNTVTLNVVVNTSPPKASTNPKGTSSICSGDSLKVSVAGLNTALFKQKWIHNNSTKTTIFLKDTGSYINLATSLEGCSTPTDVIKILVNPKPVADVSLSLSMAYCVNSKVIWKAALGKGDSVSTIGASGPYSGDTLVSTIAKLVNPRERFWVKGSNGCVSAPLSLSYSVVDSSFAPQLSGIDSQLTQVVFKWKSQPLAIKYSCSKDSGKIWTNSGNNGLDTQFAVATPADKSPVSLWVRYSINNDCMVSPAARFSATTKSCTPLDYTAQWSSNPLCVGSKAILSLGNLPKAYNVWVNGASQKQQSQVQIEINALNGKVELAVLDSAQAVCGTTKKNLLWSAESIRANQLRHNVDTLTPKIICGGSILLTHDCDTTSVKKAWIVVNGKQVTSLSNPKSGINKVLVKQGDSVWLQGNTAKGCVANSAKARIQVNPLPNANFTVSNQGALYNFTPVDTTGDHVWYIQSAPSWLSADIKPKHNLAAYSNQTVRVFHELNHWGDSCFSLSYQDLLLGELSSAPLIVSTFNIFPNPVSQGQWIQVQSDVIWSHCEITDASGRPMMHFNRAMITGNGFTFEGAAGLYRLRFYRGDDVVAQSSLLCTE